MTIEEATKYFGIGDKKIRALVSFHPDGNFFLMNGSKILIKKKQFQQFIDQASAI